MKSPFSFAPAVEHFAKTSGGSFDRTRRVKMCIDFLRSFEELIDVGKNHPDIAIRRFCDMIRMTKDTDWAAHFEHNLEGTLDHPANIFDVFGDMVAFWNDTPRNQFRYSLLDALDKIDHFFDCMMKKDQTDEVRAVIADMTKMLKTSILFDGKFQ